MCLLPIIKSQFSIMLLCILFLISRIHSQYANIEITDSSISLFKDNLIFESNSVNMTSEITVQKYNGKLCVGSNNQTINLCIDTYESYIRQWIIMVNTSSYIGALPDFINSGKYQLIKAVIANNETIAHEELMTKQFNFPLFWCSNNTFQKISAFNINNEEDNYFVGLFYVGKYSEVLNTVSLYMIVSLLVGAIIIAFTWHYLFNQYKKVFPQNTQTIQCFLKYLSYLKALGLLFCLYYYNMEINSNDPNSEATHAYLRLFITLFDSINISLFWFFLLLIANGWYVYKVTFNQVQFFAIIIGYIIFYIFFCLDIILDHLVNKKIIFNLTISDLKNIVVYSVFIELCRKFSFKTIRALKVKYTYAYYYKNTEFLAPLKQKVLIVKWHLLICIIYWLLTVIHLALLKPIIRNEKLLQLIWCYIEMFTFVCNLVLYRPRNFTRFYFVYTNDGSEEDSQIQKENLYAFKCDYKELKYEECGFNMIISNEKLTNKDINIIKRANNYPIIIIQPYNPMNITLGRCKLS